MTQPSNAKSNSDSNYRVARDLIKRGTLGPYIYPLFWPIIAIATEFNQSHSQIFYVVTVSLIFVSILRLLHIWSFDRCYPQFFALWNRLFFWSVLPHAIIWGLVFSYSLMVDNKPFGIFMAFSTAGFIAGGMTSFSPSRSMSFSFIICFILPAIIITTFIVQQFIFAAMLITYLIYMLGLANNQQQEYWLSLNNELILAKQSRTDALTQLDNRRFFDEKLNEFCHLSSRNRDQLTVMMIDCDHFKKINDTYGHDAGDECLKQLAKTLAKALTRTTDVCARYGGEEFSVILPGVEIEGAKIVGARIRQMIEETTIDNNGQQIELTVSIGSVSRKLNKFSPELPTELFKQADAALYRAKEAGRNCCVYSHFDDETETYVI